MFQKPKSYNPALSHQTLSEIDRQQAEVKTRAIEIIPLRNDSDEEVKNMSFQIRYIQVLVLRRKLNDAEATSKAQISLLKRELNTMNARLDSAMQGAHSKVAITTKDLETTARNTLSSCTVLRRDLLDVRTSVQQFKADCGKFLTDTVQACTLKESQSSPSVRFVSGSLVKIRQDWLRIRSAGEIFKLEVEAGLADMMKTVLPEFDKFNRLQTTELREKLQQETSNRRKLHNLLMDLRGNIRVFVRVRPLIPSEIRAGVLECIKVPSDNDIEINRAGHIKKWSFDRVFDSSVPNGDLFTELYQLLISALDGFNVSILAYGITGSGKTFTMQGIYDRLAIDLFVEATTRQKISGWSFEFTMSVYEVYNESIVDLLKIKNLDTSIKTNPNTGMFHIPGLTRVKLEAPSEFTRVLSDASRNRAVSTTNCNEQSSRSHLIVALHVYIKTLNGKQMEANMSLVDLAGSERLDKSGATGAVAKEGMFINKSLSALGDVINARLSKAAHVPYRNSILTSALQECIGGDSKTLMILQVSPSCDTSDETLNSLVFASRVREVEILKSPASPQKR